MTVYQIALLAVAAALLIIAVVIVILVLSTKRRAQSGLSDLQSSLQTKLAALDHGQERTERGLRDEISRNRDESGSQALSLRQELQGTLKGFDDSVMRQITGLVALEKQQLDTFSSQLGRLTETNEQKIESLKIAVEAKLTQIQADSAAKLEEMRRTVDEKLEGTLERRLGESFRQVSDRLEQVHKGLGEMQTLASGVGDLKKVLTNVKVRGTWGEVQLGNLLEQMLAPGQFEKNVATNPGSAERVEYAIKLPGKNEREGEVVWLPIDAKFPKEDYERLVEASERADVGAVEEASRSLEARIKDEAKTIQDKYIDPPHTTDFGILFLPTEGLFAEAIRRPDLAEFVQRKYRVMLAGPTTLAAMLNSLQMGFHTLAIEKRTSEVWAVLGAVKTEFGKFGGVIEKVQKKLQEAANVIDSAQTRSRAIERKLRGVEGLPPADAQALLGAPEVELAGDAEAEDAEEEGEDASPPDSSEKD